jgi:hypothetical protein
VNGNLPLESLAEESKVEEVAQPVAAEPKSIPEEEVKHEGTNSAAQVEDINEINNKEALGKPPVEDAALINKGSSDLKESSLGVPPLSRPPQGGENQAVEEEEKKADEGQISEVALQDKQVESE